MRGPARFRPIRVVPIWRAVLLAGLLVPLIYATPREQAELSSASNSGRTQANQPKIREPAAPFRAGERLTYRISWTAFNEAASLELSIPERRDFYGWPTWHFRAVAHTVSPVRALFPVDDEIDSYTDATTLESRQYETHLNELGRKQEAHWRFVALGETPRAPGAVVIVPAGTCDPLGFLYSLRLVDWSRTPEIRTPVYDGHDLYEVRARMEQASEPVEVAAGKFSADRVPIHVFQHNKEISEVNFAMWVAKGPQRTPVLMQGELPFGSLRVELTSSQP